MSGNVIKFNEEDEDDDDEGDIAGLLARHREQVRQLFYTTIEHNPINREAAKYFRILAEPGNLITREGDYTA